jgi:hypothetical protein
MFRLLVFFSLPPFLNTSILDLLKLHFKFHSLQYLTIWSISFCKPLLVNYDTAKSSAKSRPGMVVHPIDGAWELSTFMYYIISFIKMLNKYGLKLHPCLTPLNNNVYILCKKICLGLQNVRRTLNHTIFRLSDKILVMSWFW